MKANVGIYKLHLGADGGGGKRALAPAEHLSTKHNVRLFTGARPDVPALESYFGVDLGRVRFVVFDRSRRHLAAASKLFRWRRPGQMAARLDRTLQIRPHGLDVFVNNSYPSNLVCPARRGIYMCMFPHPPDRGREGPGLLRHAYHSLMDAAERSLMGMPAPDALDSYSVITANSEYTREWIRRRWGRDAEVVYSACDPAGPAAEKEKIILHVWHATGYGFDAEQYPAKQEHFGMTTVEAMSAGAVPVVLNTGGQREIVTHGDDGFLWGEL
jgi:hypothetical protein